MAETPNCPFCDIRQFKERVIAESPGFYLIATLGQITDGGYVLIFPKEHILCCGDMAPFFGLDRDLINGTLRIIRQEYQEKITVFEHGIVGQTIKHAHMHLLPTTIDLTPRIRADFPESDIVELSYPGYFQELYRQYQKPYLFWSTPEGKSFVCWDPPAPPQYLRVITAEMLGRSERANWRTMDPELDKRLWSDTVRRLKPYFVR